MLGRWLCVAIAALSVSLVLASGAAAHVKNPWHTVGSATVQDGKLVLTESVQGQAGAAWQARPGRLRAFEAKFDFAISEPSLPGDGFAFVIQGSSADALGGAGGGLGYTGIPKSIAVEFDTWQNSASDFGSPTSVADPAVPHISVHTRGTEPNDVDEQYSLGVSTDIPFLSDGTRHSVVISYRRHTLSVTFDGQPKLSVPIDLKDTLGLGHRQPAWFGFTAATGLATERHEILSFRLKTGDDCHRRGHDRWHRHSGHGGGSDWGRAHH